MKLPTLSSFATPMSQLLVALAGASIVTLCAVLLPPWWAGFVSGVAGGAFFAALAGAELGVMKAKLKQAEDSARNKMLEAVTAHGVLCAEKQTLAQQLQQARMLNQQLSFQAFQFLQKSASLNLVDFTPKAGQPVSRMLVGLDLHDAALGAFHRKPVLLALATQQLVNAAVALLKQSESQSTQGQT